MKKCDVINMFYNQKEVRFSKGYKVFEEVYEELKDELNLKREEIEEAGYTLVIITC